MWLCDFFLKRRPASTAAAGSRCWGGLLLNPSTAAPPRSTGQFIPPKLTELHPARARKCGLCKCAHPAKAGDVWVEMETRFLLASYKVLTCAGGKV